MIAIRTFSSWLRRRSKNRRKSEGEITQSTSTSCFACLSSRVFRAAIDLSVRAVSGCPSSTPTSRNRPKMAGKSSSTGQGSDRRCLNRP